MRWLDGITNAMDMNLGKLQQMVRDREPWRAVDHGVTESDMTEETEHTHDYMSIESVRSSSHIFLCGPLLLLH